MTGAWRLVGDPETGGEVGYGLVSGSDGRTRLRVTVPTATTDLDPGDAYRLATDVIEQLRAAGFLPDGRRI